MSSLYFQNYLDSVAASYSSAIAYLPVLVKPDAEPLRHHFTFYYLVARQDQPLRLYKSKIGENDAITALTDRLEAVGKAITSEKEYHHSINELVQGTTVAHIVRRFEMKDGKTDIVGFAFDYPDSLHVQYEVGPNFFMLQLGCRLLAEYHYALTQPSPVGRQNELRETIRAGIMECMSQVGLRLGVFPNVYRQLKKASPFFRDSFLESIQSVAYRPEEGRYAEGAILGAVPEGVELFIELSDPVEISRAKAIRKLLDVKKNGDEALALVVSPDGVNANAVGYCRAKDIGSEVPHIVFEGRGGWSIRQTDAVLLRVADFKPVFVETVAQQFRTTLDWPSGWSVDFLAAIQRLCGLLRDKCKGAVLIVASNAAEEAQRLSIRSTVIQPIDLSQANSGVLASIAAVDGAVFLDENLHCVAYGVILDGRLTPGVGIADRGSRYNSSANYIHSLEGDARAAAFIFSSDGGMDIVTRPRPAMGEAPPEPPQE